MAECFAGGHLRFVNGAWRDDNGDPVEIRQVVHGEWERIEDDFFDLVTFKCSVCGEEWCFEDYDDCIPQNYHYCPNCGARMDGGSHG